MMSDKEFLAAVDAADDREDAERRTGMTAEQIAQRRMSLGIFSLWPMPVDDAFRLLGRKLRENKTDGNRQPQDP